MAEWGAIGMILASRILQHIGGDRTIIHVWCKLRIIPLKSIHYASFKEIEGKSHLNRVWGIWEEAQSVFILHETEAVLFPLRISAQAQVNTWVWKSGPLLVAFVFSPSTFNHSSA